MVAPLQLKVELIGFERDDKGDISAIGPLWEGAFLPSEFGDIESKLKWTLMEHEAEIPKSLDSD